MRKQWKQFTDLFGTAPEMAALALFTAVGSLIVLLAAAAWLLKSGRPVSGVALLLAMTVGVMVCGRDLRRGRWSLVSGVVVTLWLLLTLVVCVVVGLWLFDERNGAGVAVEPIRITPR